ncbi:MAG: GMC family oxidoreductase [Thiohalocapsa sp.]
MSDDPLHHPRAKDGRAPDVFRTGGWVPMRCHRDDEEVDFAIVGTGAGGGTLACRLAEAGFSVVAFDAGPYWRPLEDFASDEKAEEKLFWLGERIVGGEDPFQLGSNNSGQSVGGSTVHFQMVSLRFRPERLKPRSKLGYAVDWPVEPEVMWRYYTEVEEALKIAGPVNYPWGPPRPRYPYRQHEPNAAGLVLARGCEALGIKWAATPLATISAPRGLAHPCVYRGFCKFGCSTNAKQSALLTWIPRAIAAGAEIRDLAMVGHVTIGDDGRATGLEYHREGRWRRQRARHVVVAGYAIETPRLLLNSACGKYPDGLANSSGLVGKYFMTQSNHAVYAIFDEEIRWYKGPPSMAITEHWNYTDTGKDFPGGYSYMSQGPLAIEWARNLASGRNLWGMALRREMTKYNHQAGLKIVGEVLPQEQNRVELADETDQYGLRIPRIVFSYGEDDKKLFQHATRFMSEALAAAGGSDLWPDSDTAHLYGGCRMGTSPRDSVTNPDGRTWDIANLWVCDASLFPTTGAVNPSLTVQANACRIADRIREMASRGEL